MTLEDAVKLLNTCTRTELRDHAFGDREVYWDKDGVTVASGYFGTHADVSLHEGDGTCWEGADARQLLACGTLGAVERNDETGPDEYREGTTMPALTLAGVWEELTGDRR